MTTPNWRAHVFPRVMKRDDLLAACDGKKIRINREAISISDEAVRKVFDIVCEDIADVEWLDFGRINVATINEQWANSKAVLEAEIPVLPPYPLCVFRFRLIYSSGAEKECFLLLKHYGMRSKREVEEDFHVKADHVLAQGHLVTIFAGFLDANSQLNWEDWLVFYENAYLPIGAHVRRQQEMDAVYDYCALWMILNTKNIAKRIEIPSDKLQKARLKAGKPLLPQITYVDTAQFERALRATQEREREPGTHASPRMHLRRGHMFMARNGKPTWRRHCIVNIDKTVYVQRDHYEIGDERRGEP